MEVSPLQPTAQLPPQPPVQRGKSWLGPSRRKQQATPSPGSDPMQTSPILQGSATANNTPWAKQASQSPKGAPPPPSIHPKSRLGQRACKLQFHDVELWDNVHDSGDQGTGLG